MKKILLPLFLLLQTSLANAVSLQNFCEKAMEANAVDGIFALTTENGQSITQKQIRSTLQTNPVEAYSWYVFPTQVLQWNLLVHPSKKTRLAAWRNQHFVETGFRKLEVDDLHFADTVERAEKFDEPTKQILSYAEGICAEFGASLIDIKTCGAALRASVLQNDTVVTKSGLVLSNTDAWKRVVYNYTHHVVASHLAKRIFRKVETAKRGIPVAGTFYQDIIESYHQVVKDPVLVENMAWDMIMLYATRGPVYNLENLFNHSLGFGLTENFGTIFVGLHVLDSFSVKQGFLYSLPESVNKTNCLIGKPYHFWYAAALTRETMQKGYSKNIARLVTYILGNLYNFGTTAFTDKKAFYKRDAMDPQNNSTRISMASRRLGIEFMTRKDEVKTSSHQLDFILNRMIQAADIDFKSIPVVASFLPETMSDYIKFRRLFSVKELNPYRNELDFED